MSTPWLWAKCDLQFTRNMTASEPYFPHLYSRVRVIVPIFLVNVVRFEGENSSKALGRHLLR